MILDPLIRADLLALLAEFERLDRVWAVPPECIAECERAMVARASLECRPLADVICDGWALLYAEIDDLTEAQRERAGLHPGSVAMRRHLARRNAFHVSCVRSGRAPDQAPDRCRARDRAADLAARGEPHREEDDPRPCRTADPGSRGIALEVPIGPNPATRG